MRPRTPITQVMRTTSIIFDLLLLPTLIMIAAFFVGFIPGLHAGCDGFDLRLAEILVSGLGGAAVAGFITFQSTRMQIDHSWKQLDRQSRERRKVAVGALLDICTKFDGLQSTLSLFPRSFPIGANEVRTLIDENRQVIHQNCSVQQKDLFDHINSDLAHIEIEMVKRNWGSVSNFLTSSCALIGRNLPDLQTQAFELQSPRD